jgi:hypothetical protein
MRDCNGERHEIVQGPHGYIFCECGELNGSWSMTMLTNRCPGCGCVYPECTCWVPDDDIEEEEVG